MWLIITITIIAFILVIIGDISNIKFFIPFGTTFLCFLAIAVTFKYFTLDYRLNLNPSGTIKISDKHNNIYTIELDSLEEFIIKDNK